MKKRITPKQFSTIGIVVDLHTVKGQKLAEVTARQTGDPEFANLLRMAQANKSRYLIAAGRFNGKGIFGVLCGDAQYLLDSYQLANARMNEVGSCTTAWMIEADALIKALLEKEPVPPEQSSDVDER